MQPNFLKDVLSVTSDKAELAVRTRASLCAPLMMTSLTLRCTSDVGGLLHQFPTPVPPRPPSMSDPSLAVCTPDDDVTYSRVCSHCDSLAETDVKVWGFIIWIDVRGILDRGFICGLFNDAVSHYVTCNDRSVTNKMEEVWKESVVVEFEILSRRWPGRTE
jgi:hypothetical protein